MSIFNGNIAQIYTDMQGGKHPQGENENYSLLEPQPLQPRPTAMRARPALSPRYTVGQAAEHRDALLATWGGGAV